MIYYLILLIMISTIDNNIDILNEKLLIFIKVLIFKILTIISPTLYDFTTFLFEKNIIQMTVAILIGSQLNNFATILNTSIINPIIDRFIDIIPNKKKYNINIHNIQFDLIKIIKSSIQVIFIIILIYIIWKVCQSIKLSNFKSIIIINNDNEHADNVNNTDNTDNTNNADTTNNANNVNNADNIGAN